MVRVVQCMEGFSHKKAIENSAKAAARPKSTPATTSMLAVPSAAVLREYFWRQRKIGPFRRLPNTRASLQSARRHSGTAANAPSASADSQCTKQILARLGRVREAQQVAEAARRLRRLRNDRQCREPSLPHWIGREYALFDHEKGIAAGGGHMLCFRKQKKCSQVKCGQKAQKSREEGKKRIQFTASHSPSPPSPPSSFSSAAFLHL